MVTCLKFFTREEFIKVIAATTNDEFDRYIASDKPLADVKPISLQEVDRNVTFDILRGWLKAKYLKGEDLNTIVDDETLKYIITNNATYSPTNMSRLNQSTPSQPYTLCTSLVILAY